MGGNGDVCGVKGSEMCVVCVSVCVRGAGGGGAWVEGGVGGGGWGWVVGVQDQVDNFRLYGGVQERAP